MPKKREGFTRFDVEIPDELAAEIRAAAERDGLKVSTWLAKLAAKKVKVEYTPPPLGRPVETETGN